MVLSIIPLEDFRTTLFYEFSPFYITPLKSFLSFFCFFLPPGNKADHICKCCCGQRQFWSHNLPRSWHCINLCTHCHHGWGLCSSRFRLSPFSTTYSTSWSKHIAKWAAAVCISSHFWMFLKKILGFVILETFGNLWNRLHQAAADFIIFKCIVRSFTIGCRCEEGKALCSCDSSFSSFSTFCIHVKRNLVSIWALATVLVVDFDAIAHHFILDWNRECWFNVTLCWWGRD